MSVREFLCKGKEYDKYQDQNTVLAGVTKYDYGYTSASICFANGDQKFEISGGVDSKESRDYLLHKVDRMIEMLSKFKAAVKEASKSA